ncbi:5-methyltetrahydropteroyltriglutamate--homocysteine S-methyltransferase [Aestuariibacter sp. AA17]|uniref:5-methyltetrahydropteroyltriglutamate--homocysteine methyltransferase n=1 Tax=Fluctibacter corallii TaxID=2984329 RepID=A0ABT3A3T5_9ALTE|nr:5-methyltetrahydropteroyltriglutamate--homocysteine S-methyltransferase [Aestuariibacter sp. AA17]MCV2883313.1 5-methyltetrahydropteroyltriglutamate--homocysteine S-methyltransferase [Aestuariibacter sp. AA17]
MAKIHNLGFPRIGANRELKFALEHYWQHGDSETSQRHLHATAREIRQGNLEIQSALDWVPVGDFSLYDHVLDTSFMLGNIPTSVEKVASEYALTALDAYFLAARGQTAHAECGCQTQAGEMTKWFDTNYHYIVPQVDADTSFALNPSRINRDINEARSVGAEVKPVILGPVTYLYLAKGADDTTKLTLLPKLLPIYAQLLANFYRHGVEWVQVDEPVLALDLNREWQTALQYAYDYLSTSNIKLLLTSYFSDYGANLSIVSALPVAGIHVPVIDSWHEVNAIASTLKASQVLSVGVIDGRNIWKARLNQCLEQLIPLHQQLGDRLWLAPSCSLLHVPIDVELETHIPSGLKDRLSFAKQKLQELVYLKNALNEGRDSISTELGQNSASQGYEKAQSNHATQLRDSSLHSSLFKRQSTFSQRKLTQASALSLPLFPTTTIGSYPQTSDIRLTRAKFKRNEISEHEYILRMQDEIAHVIDVQEQLGLDVLVHGEPERNDMVEYFGEHLEGIAVSQFAWVQSYGSRCVKPPIIYADVHRPKPITVAWSQYAQSLTAKPVKGMLTGPVTILNWSFVRDDLPRNKVCEQIALAIREEVNDLEAANIRIIQIDEAALRERLPLKKHEQRYYMQWAVDCFLLASSGVKDETQIHTHMCYSSFGEIMEDVARMDADVITIETARSNMTLLDVFDTYAYPNDIGPGVYDIHSPNKVETHDMLDRLNHACSRIPADQLWVNPDCGLKTRGWDEVKVNLRHMVAAAKKARVVASEH